MSVYQYLFLEKIPTYAIVNEAVKLVYNKKDKSFINAVLRNIIQREKKQAGGTIIKKWLDGKLIDEYGKATAHAIVESFSSKAEYCLRINLIKTSRKEIFAILEKLGIGSKPGRWLEEYMVVERLAAIRNHPIVKNGLVTIQDEAEGLVAHLLNPQKDKMVVDLCAGPGGKATHLAELMKGTGIIIAVDIDSGQLRMVGENRTRLNHNNIYPVLADGRKISDLQADYVMVDAPCSNLGTLRKRPEVLDWLRPKDIGRLANLQFELLKAAAKNLKAGGILVYSTCTITSEENEKVIDKFMDKHDFEIEPASEFLPKGLAHEFLKILPQQHDTDGVFAARMRKR